jgi:hypothetical protein
VANSQAMCTSFKQEILNGSHAFGAQAANSVRTVTTKDTFKAALFLVSGSLGAATTAYSVTSEVSGSGYSAGGIAVTNATAPTTSGTTSFWTPSASLVYSAVTLSTAFDTVEIYNSASTATLAVSVHTFGSQTVTAGTFTLTMPTNDATNGLVRIA